VLTLSLAHTSWLYTLKGCDNGSTSPVHQQSHWNISISTLGSWYLCPGTGIKQRTDMARHAAHCGAHCTACQP